MLLFYLFSTKIFEHHRLQMIYFMIVIGKTMLFSCSGIAIECKGHVTKFVTSARLVRAISDTKLTKKNGNDSSRVGAVNQAY